MHTLVAHSDAVRNRDGAELQWVAATCVNTLLAGLGQTVEAQVARRDFVPRTRNTNLGLHPVFVAHSHSTEHAARGGFLNAVGDVAAAGLHVDFCHALSL